MSSNSESSDRGMASDEEAEPTIAQDLVVTKYNMAADIVNAVLKEVIEKCKSDTAVGEICDYGDKMLLERTAKVFKKEKEVKKGIAFPTCLSVNNCICHFSPLRSDGEVLLKDGDVVKIDMGAHIDGFIATVAQTIVVGASIENKVTGKKADCIWAAYNAMELAVRMVRPEQHKNMEITDAIQRAVESYECKPVENMVSYQLKRNKIDGDKQIIQNPDEKQRGAMEKCSFEKHEVYAIDVITSTGEGKARDLDQRTTVYKKADDLIYQLKMKASRTFFSDAMKRFGSMPFSLRSFEDETRAKMGVVECERHQLLKPYPVFYERESEIVAQFKSTVLLLPTGIHKITGFAPDPAVYCTDRKIDDEKLCTLLNQSLKPNKNKKKKKAGDKSAAKTENGDSAIEK